MKFNAVSAAVAATLLLAGCGSDSNDTIQPNPQPTNPNAKYVVMDVDHQAITNKVHKVAIGRFQDNVKEWITANPFVDGQSNPHDVDGDELITVYDAEAAGIVNAPVVYREIRSADVVAFLAENPDGLGQHSSRPDIFIEGQYSVFDLLRYVAYTDPKLQLNVVKTHKESDFGTVEFEVSYDSGNNQVFGDESNDENNASANWYYRFKTSGGDFMRAVGEPDGEATYNRMDEMWAQDDMSIRFQPFYEVTTKRRQYLWQKEMDRLEKYGYTIPKIQLKKPTGAPYDYVLADNGVEVTAHNLRPDVFQPNVITVMDWFMSAIDAGYDFKLSYWPVIDTGAKVYSYSVNHADGLSSQTGKGWVMMVGEQESGSDYSSKIPSCNWDETGASAPESAFPAEECVADYQYSFGANVLHLMSDVWVANYPKEYTMLNFADHYAQWGMEEYNGYQPGKEATFSDGTTAMVETLVAETNPDSDALLTETHYGWGKADCMLCHNAEDGHMNGAPLPVNDGFDVPQAYYCAECHGSNGAPFGHGAEARCFWCHSDSKTPELHGDAFSQRTVASKLDAIHEENFGTPDDIYFNGTKSVMPRDKAGNADSYPSTGVQSGSNSDWSMSKHFPDPYSCMTCHPNQ